MLYYVLILVTVAFSALMLSSEVLAWLSVWNAVQTCHSLSLAIVKSRLVLPFWYQLTRVLPDKGPLHGYVCNIGYCLNGLFSVNNAVMYGCNTNLHAM